MMLRDCARHGTISRQEVGYDAEGLCQAWHHFTPRGRCARHGVNHNAKALHHFTPRSRCARHGVRHDAKGWHHFTLIGRRRIWMQYMMQRHGTISRQELGLEDMDAGHGAEGLRYA
eukprot:1159526-Pelagomonas_calceolata.AAC.2